MRRKRAPPQKKDERQKYITGGGSRQKPVPPKEGSRMQNTVIKYEDTTSQNAIDEYLRRWRREQEQAYKWKRRRIRITKQRIAGLILLAITIPAVSLLNGDATVAAVTVPAGVGLILGAGTEAAT